MAEYSFSERLHDFLKSNELITPVAIKMGFRNGQYLSRELRPSNWAKLGVDELVSLCRAIRELGHGNELDAILSEYMGVLTSGPTAPPVTKDPILLYVDLQRAMAAVSEVTGEILSHPNEKTLRKAKNLITTRLTSSVNNIKEMLDSQLESMRNHNGESIPEN